jgi:hypothetical protein
MVFGREINIGEFIEKCPKTAEYKEQRGWTSL